LDLSCHLGLRSMTVVGFKLGRRLVVELGMEPLLVEPRHPGARGELEVVESLPRSTVGLQGGGVAVQFGLEQPHDRLGHGVVVALTG
jgi:hypothetical protein